MKKRKTFILLFLFYIISIQCLPDRMPPAPIENQRPEFVSFSPVDSAAIAVPLRKSVTLIFNEPMMVSSFSENFTLQGIHGEISGTFSANDSLVTFTPGEDMMIASVYTATVSGGVRDKNGNSLTLDEDWQVSTWFFTEGQYSHDGFPYVFIADRSFDILYQVGNFEELLAQSTEVIQPRGMAFSPDGQTLFVVSKQAAGQVAVIDPVTFSKIQDISVGVGPEEIAVTQDKIFVVNVSARTISVLALSGFALLHTIEFTDGFRPRDIAHHPLRNIIYVSSNDLTKPGILKIIDAEN
jgi:YVTN family beta-propeller protein